MRKWFTRIIVAMLMVVMAISIFYISDYYSKSIENEEMYKEIKESIKVEKSIVPEKEVRSKNNKSEKNPEMVGWISIPGTGIDYPVMQSQDRKSFYLNHDYYGNYSVYGCPYLQENCRINQSDNLIIYGHHMSDGSMFAPLQNYVSLDFWQSHQFIEFTAGQNSCRYRIFCVFKTSADSGFRYNAFVNAENKEQFDEFIDNCRKHSLYDTGISADFGDSILTLSTCEYSLTNGRLVVMAKKI